jgi:soluble lytic murein transglycosylase
MANRKKKLIFTVFSVVILVMLTAYFLIPKMFADEVYPLKYADLIVKYSTKYDVDPALVAAVILQESRFNPNAKSSAGAQGLMQFMPGTAKTMAKETGRYPNYDIFDAETSIDFGAAHIRDLLLKYNGDVDQALAGYNAGTGTVDSWVRQNIFDRVINSNSKSETVTYVRKVKNYQRVYTEMYGEELGLKKDVSSELRETPKEEEDARVRGFVWVQIFQNIFSSGQK